jgi:sulfur carrier protein ThiS
MMALLRPPHGGGDSQADGAAKLVLHNKEFVVRPGTTILFALIKMGIDVQVVRPLRDGQLIDLGTVLVDGDRIDLVPLIAGG